MSRASATAPQQTIKPSSLGVQNDSRETSLENKVESVNKQAIERIQRETPSPQNSDKNTLKGIDNPASQEERKSSETLSTEAKEQEKLASNQERTSTQKNEEKSPETPIAEIKQEEKLPSVMKSNNASSPNVESAQPSKENSEATAKQSKTWWNKVFSHPTNKTSDDFKLTETSLGIVGVAFGILLLGNGYANSNKASAGVGVTLSGLGGFGLYSAYNRPTIDYTNSNDLLEARENAKTAPFSETVKTHGWKNIVTHELLDPKSFQDCYLRLENEEYSFMNRLKLHQSVLTALRELKTSPYQVPPLSDRKEILMQEAQPLSFSEIKDAYDLKALKEVGASFDPSFISEKIHLEAKNLSFSEIKEKFDRETLSTLGVSFESSFITEKFLGEAKNLTFSEILKNFSPSLVADMNVAVGIDFWTQKWIDEAKDLGFQKTQENLPSADLVPHSDFANKLIAQRQLVMRKLNLARDEAMLEIDRFLTTSESKRGVTMSSKKDEAEIAFAEKKRELDDEESTLRKAYIKELTSSLPRSA